MYRVDQGVCYIVNTQSTLEYKLISLLFHVNVLFLLMFSLPLMTKLTPLPRPIPATFMISIIWANVLTSVKRPPDTLWPLSVTPYFVIIFRVRRRYGCVSFEFVHDVVPEHRIDHVQHVQFRRASPYPIDDVIDTYSRCLACQGRGRRTCVVMHCQSTYFFIVRKIRLEAVLKMGIPMWNVRLYQGHFPVHAQR